MKVGLKNLISVIYDSFILEIWCYAFYFNFGVSIVEIKNEIWAVFMAVEENLWVTINFY